MKCEHCGGAIKYVPENYPHPAELLCVNCGRRHEAKASAGKGGTMDPPTPSGLASGSESAPARREATTGRKLKLRRAGEGRKRKDPEEVAVEEMQMRKCKKCGAEHPATEEFFIPICGGKYLEGRCKECKKKNDKEKYDKRMKKAGKTVRKYRRKGSMTGDEGSPSGVEAIPTGRNPGYPSFSAAARSNAPYQVSSLDPRTINPILISLRAEIVKIQSAIEVLEKLR